MAREWEGMGRTGVVYLADGVVIEPETPAKPYKVTAPADADPMVGPTGPGILAIVTMTLIGIALTAVAHGMEGLEASIPVALLCAVVIRVIRHAYVDDEPD